MCGLWVSTTPGLAGGADGVRAAAQKLFSCEDELLRLNGELDGLELEAWVSPAGRAFRESLQLRRLRLDRAAAEVAEAAAAVDAFGQAAAASPVDPFS
ncbi:hypothetical protein AAIH25_11380 [Arthrobacter crystallopoietes]|uniref:hypothetical protein n=1 Tax=Micrococcaceae TaxID=1268 RepID=UPI0021C8C734|nr:hypothetical protein [Arthrobacter sp. Marseille-P9274]